ncbi:PAS domain-containing sensor histidine kinase [Chryseolinea lacunae]|uniref:histidine kinase n=1 Tax=Chryseolinea lacunae TaxID=2801331 RepID=A0ABS1KLV3_9BACT|nr:PAS domain S-box protein [Chryseolinea lacunae]MBL0740207.1 PAS domain S-box protein [Chryseolinea lacunae]
MDKIPFKKKYVQDDTFLNALADAYRLQESIISTTELAVISTTTEGLITSFNRAAEVLSGYTAEEMIGKATPMVLHDNIQLIERADEISTEMGVEIEPNFDVLTAKARLKKTADRREWTYIHKNGHRFPVLVSFTGLFDEKGHLTGFASIATDITESKAAEKKIRDSEAHLQALLHSIDDIAFEVSRDGVYTNIWTRKDYLLLVTPRNEYVGKKMKDVLPPELLQQYMTAIEKVFHTQKSESIEYPLPNHNRWSSGKISYIDENRVLILVRDITAKKKSELLLAQSEQKFRTLTENIPGVIYLRQADASQGVVYINQQVREIVGHEPDDFVSGKISFMDLCHPEDREPVSLAIDKALAAKETFHIKYRVLHKSGLWRWVEEIGSAIQPVDGAAPMIEGFISDITRQKEAEAQLEKIAEENQLIFNNALNLIVIASFKGYFLKVNQYWTALLGWSEEELKARKFIEFIHPDDQKATENAVVHLRGGHHIATFENRYRRKDGTYRWLLWTSATDVKNQRIYASAVDITERKKSEDELLRSKQNVEAIAMKLQEQNRQLDEFAHIISHNLRSPVGNIKALIGLLSPSSSVEEYKQIFEKLRHVANNLGETMNELMETLRAKKETDIEQVDIRFAEIFDKVVQSLQGELLQTGATITHDFNDAPAIHYSRPYLESIFQNLLSNAIKYRSPDRPPHVHATTRWHNDSIELIVRDNGLGIEMDKFGDKLFGLHKTFHDHKDARGVGLFLIKTQIEALGGSISAESQAGMGSTFTVRFGVGQK